VVAIAAPSATSNAGGDSGRLVPTGGACFTLLLLLVTAPLAISLLAISVAGNFTVDQRRRAGDITIA
jgi:hypothetical protein